MEQVIKKMRLVFRKIDPTNTCSPNMNWTASVDPSGGTHGRQNSVFANVVDTIPPYIINVSISSGNELLVKFSEHVDTSTSLVLSNYDLQQVLELQFMLFLKLINR